MEEVSVALLRLEVSCKKWRYGCGPAKRGRGEKEKKGGGKVRPLFHATSGEGGEEAVMQKSYVNPRREGRKKHQRVLTRIMESLFRNNAEGKRKKKEEKRRIFYRTGRGERRSTCQRPMKGGALKLFSVESKERGEKRRGTDDSNYVASCLRGEER